MRHRVIASTLLMVCAVLSAAALPKSAAAQATPQPIVSIVDIVVTSVEAGANGLVANADVTLDVLGRTITRTVEIPLELGGTPGAEGECDILNLALGPVHLDLLGLVVNLDDCAGGPVTVDITAIEGGGLLGDLLCSVAGLLDSGADLGAILEGLTDDELALLNGGIRDVLNSILGELLATDATAAGHAADQHAGPGHVCNILTLEIPEGLTLNVLGLLVETSPICLDVHAERGSGNLLGNLLCSLSNLLDNNGNANGQASLVRNILRLLDRIGL